MKTFEFRKTNCCILPLPPTLNLKVVKFSQILAGMTLKPYKITIEKDNLMQKEDKVNTIVILDKVFYIVKM